MNEKGKEKPGAEKKKRRSGLPIRRTRERLYIHVPPQSIRRRGLWRTRSHSGLTLYDGTTALNGHVTKERPEQPKKEAALQL